MPRVVKSRPKVSKTKTKDDIEIVDGVATISVGLKIGLSANFQTVSIEAGLEFKTKAEDKDRSYDKAWSIINAEVSNQLDDAKDVLGSLSDIRSNIERGR